ncbi:hypothetical protein [Nocardia callitridis]
MVGHLSSTTSTAADFYAEHTADEHGTSFVSGTATSRARSCGCGC